MKSASRSLSLVASLLVAASIALSSFGGQVGAASGHARAKAICPHRNPASGTIKMSDWQFPDTLNPYQTTLAVSAEVYHGLFDTLYRYYQYGNGPRLFSPLLSRVPSKANGDFSNQGKTIVLRLKHGLRWSNGAEITSRDIWFGWKVEMDPSVNACAGSCDVISRIDTPNRYNAILHLKHTYAPAIPNALPSFVWPTSWRGAWKQNDWRAAAQKLGQSSRFNFEGSGYPTNGPYQVSKFVMRDRIELTPMRYYQGMSCGGYVKKIIFVSYPNAAAMIAAAARHETDVTYNYTTADLKDLFKNKSKFKTYVNPSFSLEFAQFNVDKQYKGKRNPLHDVRVRQALTLALDKYGLIQSSLGVSRPQAAEIIAWTPWVKTPQLVQPFTDTRINGQWDPLAGTYVVPGSGRALSDAKKLLARAGYAKGFTLDFYSTVGKPVRMAQEAIMAQNWAKLGVTVAPNWLSTSKLFASYESGGIYQRGKFQVAMYGFLQPPDPDDLKYDFQTKYIDRRHRVHNNTVNGNYSGIQDPIVDRAFTVAARSLDPGTRFKQYSLIQQRIDQQAYWISLFFRPTIATNDGKVKNFSTNPTTAPQWNIWAWKAAKTM